MELMSNENKAETQLSAVQQIVQHAVNKEPSQMSSLVHKEIASRVMQQIDTRRAVVGKKLFGK